MLSKNTVEYIFLYLKQKQKNLKPLIFVIAIKGWPLVNRNSAVKKGSYPTRFTSDFQIRMRILSFFALLERE